MNKVVLVGRLTRNPDVKQSKTENETRVAAYTLAVPRKWKKDEVDFIRCTSFGKQAEFAEKYFTKGLRVAISGRIETDSYTNKNGDRIFTTEVKVEDQEFAQSKSESDGFINIDQAELPFS